MTESYARASTASEALEIFERETAEGKWDPEIMSQFRAFIESGGAAHICEPWCV